MAGESFEHIVIDRAAQVASSLRPERGSAGVRGCLLEAGPRGRRRMIRLPIAFLDVVQDKWDWLQDDPAKVLWVAARLTGRG